MIKVLHQGFYSSIQDSGRFDFQHYGVPIAGAMDQNSANLANALVGNSFDSAVLEITMIGPKLEFLEETKLCLSGAELNPKLNDVLIELNQAFSIKKGDVLSFGKLENGFRAYLAVSGGFNSEEILQSRSMYKGITSQFRIDKGDFLHFTPITGSDRGNATLKVDKDHLSNQTIEVYAGPEYDQLSFKQKDILKISEFSIAKENSRMAYQLKESLENNLGSIITSLVLPGTVQLTPSGKLIILMRDCQTTGGYPRILQLSDDAINGLAQKFTGDTIKFKLLNQTT